MQAKTERFEMRLDQPMIERLDVWRNQQDDAPSRSEAVRRLMEVGLQYDQKSKVHITDGEKLILSMLCDLHRQNVTKGEMNPEFIQEAIWGGHHWALRWQYGLLDTQIDNEKDVNEVCEILDMWFFLERGYARLSKSDKSKVDSVRGSEKEVHFLGFDANHESKHYDIAFFLINNMGRFESLKKRALNSHFPFLMSYRRMLEKFRIIRPNIKGNGLNPEQIIAILKQDPEISVTD